MYENCLKQSNDSFRYSNLNFRVVIMHVLINLRDNRSWAAKMSLKLGGESFSRKILSFENILPGRDQAKLIFSTFLKKLISKISELSPWFSNKSLWRRN